MSADEVQNEPSSWPEVLERWPGRALTGREIRGRHGQDSTALRQVDEAVAAGLVERVPGIVRGADGWRCMRCGGGSVRLLPCGQCGRRACPFCEECAVLSPLRGCDHLYRLPWPPAGNDLAAATERGFPAPLTQGAGWPRYPFSFTLAQQRVAEQLTRWIRNDRGPRSMLLWAACGAGKTEMVLAAAATVLRQGGRVLVATPRREVVKELEPRLRRMAAPLPVAAWYGGAPPDEARPNPRAPLVIATTHQTLRFYRAFHLVAVDELDAFPFRDHAVLRRAVDRAALPGARRLWVTATPPRWLRRETTRRNRERTGVVFLPARPHGHPLPEPRLFWSPRLAAWPLAGAWPGRLVAWLRASRQRGARLLVFAPTVDHARRLPEVLGRLLAEPVAAVWAAHPDRGPVIEGFRRGSPGVLVSTSLLERGVTLPSVDVLVLFPEHPLFDTAALVQMAGRSGRSPEDPRGRVLFAGAWPAREALQAVAAIRAMNRRARREGLLRPQLGEARLP